MSSLRYCLDRRVLAVLGVIALGTAILAPRALGAALPLLLLTACPVAMVVMAVAMGRAATPAAPPASVDSMRAELAELAERQRHIERDLAAAETAGVHQMRRQEGG